MADPAQITTARISTIVSNWISFIDGNLGAKWSALKLLDAKPLSAWSLNGSNGLWWENSDPADDIVFPIVHESSITITAYAALLYVASALAGEQPHIELVEVSSTGVAVLGSPPPTPTAVGWHLITLTGVSHVIGANSVVMARVGAGHIGDRVAGVAILGDRQ